ncbi:hypothetical protein F9279_15145 [Bacillus sp. B1-b2]|nr:hypothetical protein F9279_15145 [Bacillus sp. B1-b2]
MLLTACTAEEKQYNYLFIGEGDFWKAEYVYRGTEVWKKEGERERYSYRDSDEFTLTYKGAKEELSTMKSLEYQYKTSGGSSTMQEEFDEPTSKVTFTQKGSSENGSKVSEDEVIQVQVEWDGHKEIFELRNTNK